MPISEDTLIYDIETKTFGQPDPDKDRLRIFGCYSYKTKKYYLLTKKEDIQRIINAHKILVGFNNQGTKYQKGYDNPILAREGINFKYKIIIDLMTIFKQRASQMKIKKGMLGDILMRYSLDYITRTLDLVDDDEAKLKIDYKLFEKDVWTKEEMELVSKYTKRDIEITKKLYEWVEDYFGGFTEFLSQEDINKKYYLTKSLAGLAYKAICKACNWEEQYNEEGNIDDDRISGGYVAYPAGEKFEGNLYCLDFNCLPENTKIRMVANSGYYYDKLIQNIKVGDKVLNQEGKQEVSFIESRDYKGEIINIELTNGKILECTPDHKIPVYRNNKFINIEAKDIKETDELITTLTKRGEKNPDYKCGQILKMCEVCGTEFNIFPSQNFIKCCSSECSNYLRSINNPKPNLGKTKYDTLHLMKMSLERKGKKRDKQTIKNISEETKKGMKKIYKEWLVKNKKRDMSFMKDISWHEKRRKSKLKNIYSGKFEYKGIYFKSNWERIVAKNLDKNNIKWKYEPQVFQLSNDEFYTPDFYLPEYDKWIEVKGYMYDHSRIKIKKFIEEHHDLLLLSDIQKIKDEKIKWLELKV